MTKKYAWKFNEIPSPRAIENFLDRQVSLFARYTDYLCGADGEPIVDTFIVEHNNGVKNLEVQFNGVPGRTGDTFCFPGYFPGDMDDDGRPLINVCNTNNHFYGKIAGFILNRAKREFNMEVLTSERKIEQYQKTGEWS